MSLFLIATGRYDKFQGLAFRLNLDPGFKYIVLKSSRTALWGEAGYDFQHDTRTEAGRVELDEAGNPKPVLLDKTRIDHSGRVFVGFRHAFTQDIAFSTGIEYLQSFITTDLGSMNSRVNANAVLAAKLFQGFSIGIGFNAAYDRLPIPGRQNLDTTTTLSLIYGWTDAAPAAKKDDKAKCPVCPEVKPAPTPTTPTPTGDVKPADPNALPTSGEKPAADPANPAAAPAPAPAPAEAPKP